ncbi:MAG: tRNA (pseudouridine(54)-N(1))-methyltransferase TrmY [archaeon]
MRQFIYYSRTAPTSGSYVKEDLHKSGRLDIAIHSLIAAFFLSHRIRTDVKMHLFFAGPPITPKHLEIKPATEGQTGEDKVYFSKRNVSKVIKKMLYKNKDGEKVEVFPGFQIETYSILPYISSLKNQNLYILDPKGEDIRTAKIKTNPIFILGDQRGLPSKELKRLKSLCTPITVGPATYFASQTITIVNNELDRREVEDKKT